MVLDVVEPGGSAHERLKQSQHLVQQWKDHLVHYLLG
jgi:hypothetical protein